MTGEAVPVPARAALAVLVGLALLSPWPFGCAHPRLAGTIALLALLTSLAVALAALRWKAPFALPPPVWPLAGFIALAAVQLLPLPSPLHGLLAPGPAAVWHPAEPEAAAVLGPGAFPLSVYPDGTREWLAFALGVSALAALAVPALRDRRYALLSALVVGGGGLAVALFGIVARLLFGNRLYGEFAVPTVAPFGPFVSKNHFAGYVEMASLLALGLAFGLADETRRKGGSLGWIEGSRAGRVVWALGAVGIMALAVLVSLSRGGVVSLAAGAIAFFALRALVRRHPRARSARYALVALMGLLALAALAFAVLPPGARARILSLGGITGDLAGAFRLSVWRDTLRLAAASPILGHGFGAYADALPPFKTAAGTLRVEHAESDWLELLAEGGGVGLLLAGLFIVLAAGVAVRGLRAQDDRLRRGLGLGAAAASLALLVHGAFDFNLHIPSNAILFAFLLALLAGAAGAGGAVRPTGMGLLVLVLVGGVLAALRAPGAGSPPDVSSLRRAVATGDPRALRRATAEAELVGHLRRRPADAEAWAMLAWVRATTKDSPPSGLLGRARHLDPLNPGLAREVERLERGRPLR